MDGSAQQFSHYPAWPAPVRVPLITAPEYPCSYLPEHTAQTRVLLADRVEPLVYEQFMDAGFRRSGRIIYQPVCRGCRDCVPLRLLVDQFRPSKSQRRCQRRNADLTTSIGPAVATDEKYELYSRYVHEWHGHDPLEDSREDFERFLYDSPVDSIEFSYRDRSGRLLAAGICDVCPRSLSTVYFYFDPRESMRGLGTYGAMGEIAHAQSLHLPRYYLGYWISKCGSMAYKSGFRPCQTLDTDGVWRDFQDRQ
jgi:arginine-tRNA-protein transferase